MRHQPVYAEGIEPVGNLLHAIRPEVKRIAAEAFAHYLFAALPVGCGGDEFAAEVQGLEFAVGNIAGDMVKPRNAEELLERRQVSPAGSRRRVFLADAMSA